MEYKKLLQAIIDIKDKKAQAKALASIFDKVSIKPTHAAPNKGYAYQGGKLPDFDKNTSLQDFFPSIIRNGFSPTLPDSLKEEYDKIERELAGDDYTLHHLIYKYFSRITDEEKDVISLFDKYRIAKAQAYLNSESYLLVKGDFSGMQKFIYGGINREEVGSTQGLSKRLRGRSFYIAAMADMIAEHFAESLGLPIANVIYSGGGHFLLLCENNDESTNTIQVLTQKINEFLLSEVSSALSFITGQAECRKADLENSAQTILAVNHDLNGKKYKAYKDNLTNVFGMEIEARFGKKDKDDTSYDEQIGTLLPKIETIIEFTLKDMGPTKTIADYIKLQNQGFVVCEVQTLNKVVIMTEKGDAKNLKTLLKYYEGLVKSVKIIRINKNSDFLDGATDIKSACKEIEISFGFRYLGNYAPLKVVKDANEKEKEVEPKAIMDFTELIKRNRFKKTLITSDIQYATAHKENDKDKEEDIKKDAAAFAHRAFPTNYENEALAYPKLAVMRLDVDNLGTIFAFGMKGQTSLQQTAALSREFHLFFTGYFSVLAKKYDIYITYSGGDDAFVVGSWIGIVHFAQELYHKFKEFVCNNTEITFSAGVFLCNAHYPVSKFAFDAGEEEEKSKKFAGKNAITIFDHTLSFEHYDAMLNFAVNMLNHVRGDNEKADKEKIARSMVHRILRIIKSCVKEKDGAIKIERIYRETANLHYLFARHGFNEQEITKATKDITKDVMEIILRHFKKDTYKTLYPNFLIPTHYVTLLTRKEK